jgi:hypothetical protein
MCGQILETNIPSPERMNILGSHGHDCKKILGSQWIYLPANSDQSYVAVQRLFIKLRNKCRKQRPIDLSRTEKEQMPDAGVLADQS